jgi:hypothetical protein
VDASRDHLNRKLRTLMHCALYRATLRLSCRNCPHSVSWEAVRVWWHFHRKGIDDRIPEVLQRFYCTKCWSDRQMVSRPQLQITRDMPRECHADNDQFADGTAIGDDFDAGLIDGIDLWMIAEATGDPYAAEGFFGFDPYGRQKPEDLTICTGQRFLPPVQGPAHYELRFPYLRSDIGQIRRLPGPPQRILVPGPALDKAEVSLSTDAMFSLDQC